MKENGRYCKIKEGAEIVQVNSEHHVSGSGRT